MQRTVSYFFVIAILSACTDSKQEESSESTIETEVSDTTLNSNNEVVEKMETTINKPLSSWDYSLDWETGEEEAKAVDYGYAAFPNKSEFATQITLVLDLVGKTSTEGITEKARCIEASLNSLNTPYHFPLARTEKGKLIVYLYGKEPLDSEDAKNIVKDCGVLSRMAQDERPNWEDIEEYVR